MWISVVVGVIVALVAAYDAITSMSGGGQLVGVAGNAYQLPPYYDKILSAGQHVDARLAGHETDR